MLPGLEIPAQYGIPALVGLAIAVIGIIGREIRARRSEKHPPPPTFTEIWSRMDVLSERLDASERRERAAVIAAEKSEASATAAKSETAELREIIVRWFTRLEAWDRKGPMPTPGLRDMRKLGIASTHSPSTKKEGSGVLDLD